MTIPLPANPTTIGCLNGEGHRNLSDSCYPRALVIGASITGLLAAWLLTRHFPSVVLVERDELSSNAGSRSGVPQDIHGHAVLSSGYRILCQLFPDLDEELERRGAPAGDLTADTAILYRGGWVPHYRSGIVSRGFSRLLLESLIRERVLAHPAVRLVTRQQVVGLQHDPASGRVIGIRTVARGASPGEQRISAELTVDASGRNSRLPDWLDELGYGRPRETVVNSHFGYATRRYRKPPGQAGPWKVLAVYGRPPELPRCGLIYPEEHDIWVVSMIGAMKDYPPTDDQGFLEFARSLPTPRIYEAIRNAESISPISSYRYLENRMRHFEQLARWPDGLVALGDAACTFNPVYAQGITVSAKSALLLERTCREVRFDSTGNQKGMTKRFQRRLSRELAIPWLLATCEDSRYSESTVRRSLPTRLLHWYLDQALLQLPNSRMLTQALAEVIHLERHPAILMHPMITLRVLTGFASRSVFRGRTGGNSRKREANT